MRPEAFIKGRTEILTGILQMLLPGTHAWPTLLKHMHPAEVWAHWDHGLHTLAPVTPKECTPQAGILLQMHMSGAHMWPILKKQKQESSWAHLGYGLWAIVLHILYVTYTIRLRCSRSEDLQMAWWHRFI
eukprot:scaffold318106_cov13-Tisochrysis_lutea.AAC.1